MSDFTEPRRIADTDDITGFQCGVPIVDNWLYTHLKNAGRRHTAVAYGSFHEGRLAGFYTLSSYAVRREAAREWLGRNAPDPVPAILLGMLGVDIRYQTRHLGSKLLKNAVERALSASEIIGARALMVEPVSQHAAGFYERFGFRPVTGSDILYIPLK